MSNKKSNIFQQRFKKPVLKKLCHAMLAITPLFMANTSFALKEINDKELATVTGKELLQFSTIMPGEMGNPNGDVGFYRLGLDAKIEINSNINKLRLGCDNADGTNCDISIDKVVLTGITPKLYNGQAINYPFVDKNNGINGQADTVKKKLDVTKKISQGFEVPKNIGPQTDFVMDKPFIELAIQNPNSLVNRKIVGYRFGAKENWGIMSTGDGPPLVNNQQSIEIYGPGLQGGITSYGKGQSAISGLWNAMKNSSYWGANTDERFLAMKRFINASIERGHTGVNSITGRLPTRLDNVHVYVQVLDIAGFIPAPAKTAIVAGNLNRKNVNDFGLKTGVINPNKQGYLRNTLLGDSDTVYDVATYGKYVGNGTSNDNNYKVPELRGRAIELKRSSRAKINGMIVHIHDVASFAGILDFLGGDKLNISDLSTKVFHQLQYGLDLNNNGKYDPGEGSKHQAFSYQTLDGLQWITTDVRFGNQYDELGNVVKGQEKSINGGGYDWLSTRAGWWLESPQANVSHGFLPFGQVSNKGVPAAGKPIKLSSIDLGHRPVDNCWGELTFC